MASPGPNRVLPKVTSVSTAAIGRAVGAVAAKAKDGHDGPAHQQGRGARVSGVSEGASEIIGSYAAISGREISTGAPAPRKPAPVATDPGSNDLDEGTTVKLGDLEQFVRMRQQTQDGVAEQEFDAGAFLRKSAPQKRLGSVGLAASALGHLATGRCPR